MCEMLHLTLVTLSETVIFFSLYAGDVPKFQHLSCRFSDGSGSKESACNVGDLGLIPGWGRSPREGNGHPFQYFCLENPVDGVSWQATGPWGREE